MITLLNSLLYWVGIEIAIRAEVVNRDEVMPDDGHDWESFDFGENDADFLDLMENIDIDDRIKELEQEAVNAWTKCIEEQESHLDTKIELSDAQDLATINAFVAIVGAVLVGILIAAVIALTVLNV